MSYEPLHHKYRPQTFAELVGQSAIATTLTNAIISQRIAPAYLFTGPRGTGKTSSARILAKSLNCLRSDKPTPTPCGQCEVCRAIARGSALDVIEIDAASNTGVDNIREIIERTQFAPLQCRYKVYVIDECHMLSAAAFNALLKTLEEPPERVIFVLATTDPQRVLPTIISRCQRFDYRRIPLESMVSHLKDIASTENIHISYEAITLVAQIANGGLRDAESLLDQLSLLSGTISAEQVWDLVGAVPERDLMALLKAIKSDNPEAVLEQCRNLMNRGREPLVVLQNLAGFYLNLLIAKTAPSRQDMVAVTAPTWKQLCAEADRWEKDMILQGQQHLKDSEVQIKNSSQPLLWLEVTLLGLLPSAYRSEQPAVHLGARQAPPRQSQVQPNTTRLRTVVGKDKQGEQGKQGGRGREDRAYPSSIEVQPPSQSTAPTSEPERLQPEPQPQKPAPSPVKESPTPEPVVPVPSKVPAVQQVSNEQIWQQVLEHLHPPMTQVFVVSNCHLISFEGSAACVGVNAEHLLNQAKNKLPNIKAAFEAVCKHTVNVNLQVATPPQSQETSGQQPVKQEIGEARNPVREGTPSKPIASPVTNEIPDKPTQVTVKPQPTTEAMVDQTSFKVSEPSALLDNPASQSTETPISLEDNNESASTNYSEEDFKKAAESLVKCFEAEIIILDDQTDYAETEAPPQPSETTVPIQSEESNNIELEASEQKPHQTNGIIRGRVDLRIYENEDEIPF
ncbi:MAG: DNA polymerase III subunit gamma/tau [Xenococcaceae cyanobacterium]